VLEQVIGKGTLVDHLSPVITPSSMVTFVTDETTPHGTSGITATWIGEGVAITESKPLLKQVNVPLYKLAGLCHASDELLEDSPGMNNYILGKIATQIRFKLEDSLVAGTGSAQPLGILAGPGKIVVDNATTVLDPKDIGNMVARLLPGHFETSFFLLHSTVLPHLWNLTIGTTPILVPDYTKSPYGTIMGRPVVVSEACSDYNTVGDFALVSSGGYALAVKSSGLRQDTTLALGFDVGLQSFRATLRVGGTPLLSAPVARKNGSTTLGHTIILDKRE
jgi:HK97 family phage major capsid protein